MNVSSNYIDSNRVISQRKIEKALYLGNLNGVQRLAKFVGAPCIYPEEVYDRCEEQRYEHYEMMRGGK